MRILPYITGLAGAIIVVIGTSGFGPGITPDAVSYISCADSILDGNGFYRYDGSAFVGWPPLFPAILAFLGFLGFDTICGARFFNAACFGLIIIAFSHLLRMGLRSKALIICGTLSLLTVPMVITSFMAWSEPFFTLLLVLFLIVFQKFLDSGKQNLLFLAAIIASLACLQRYIGVTLVLAGIFIMLAALKEKSIRQKLKYMAVFLSVALIPLALWMARNQMTASVLTGYRSQTPYTLGHYITATFEVITGWLIHESTPLWARLCIIASCGFLLFFAQHRRDPKRPFGLLPKKWGAAQTVGVFSLIYTLFVIYSSMTTHLDKMPYRYLVPVYFGYLFMIFVLLEKIQNRLPELAGLKTKKIIVLICMAWLGFQFIETGQAVSNAKNQGIGVYSTKNWSNSGLIKWLKQSGPKCAVYSNSPDLLYVHCKIRAKISPGSKRGLSEFTREVSKKDMVCLVWFFNSWRSHLYDVNELSKGLNIYVLARFPEGAIFQVAW